ncbi:DUF2255 family protein [uncultured Lactobacillus sp.]|uniref:DUF2255 family protein n=1 Tax=uncultured Lactobacillus sp. TaxID=153152 RepID=UPI0028051844|nr:DUF2255 family protein [uncultured Lactobacillus sp.]
MTEWTKDELKDFETVEALQNRPYADDGKNFEQDIPTWTVVDNGNLYVRGAKGKDTKWVDFGTRNGGQVGTNGKNYEVNYEVVSDPVEIKAVSEAFTSKYPAGSILTMMTGKTAESAIVKLTKK